MRETVEDYRHSRLSDDDCQLLCELPREGVFVWGDRTRLAQVLSNLIHNGCKFGGGPNQVSVALRSDAAAKTAEISVTDRGIGMNAETLAGLFQPFMQADNSVERSRGGLGLGLALVHALVTLHEGRVFAHSEGLGLGCRLTIHLPLSLRTMPDNSPPPGNSSTPRRVLLIDDRRDAVMPLEKILQIFGHEVRVAADGPAGLELARSFSPEIVLCDIGLPNGMNGYDVARAMRGDPRLAGVYLVAVTGYGQEEDRELARSVGFDYHLTKPVSKDELLKVVQQSPRFTV